MLETFARCIGYIVGFFAIIAAFLAALEFSMRIAVGFLQRKKRRHDRADLCDWHLN